MDDSMPVPGRIVLPGEFRSTEVAGRIVLPEEFAQEQAVARRTWMRSRLPRIVGVALLVAVLLYLLFRWLNDEY